VQLEIMGERYVVWNTAAGANAAERKRRQWELPVIVAKKIVRKLSRSKVEPPSEDQAEIEEEASKEEGEWAVMRDYCSHRGAPLSQGRVDPNTKCIECPYHGWQFSADGACTKVPQLEPETSRSPALQASAFATKLTGDVIWAKLPIGMTSYEDAAALSPEPEEVFPEVRTPFRTFDFFVQESRLVATLPSL
jgi:nitrite reductase/ring-hydroxylating ferredoxin subunit